MRKDPDLLVIKRSIRAAVVMPLVFALAHVGFSDPQVGLFAAFGSFALLLLVEFTGPARTRLVSYAGLYVVGAVLRGAGHPRLDPQGGCGRHDGRGRVPGALRGNCCAAGATATTAALLTFVLPVAVAQPASAIGPRLVGWTLAAVFCVPACMLVWPPPWHDNLRRRLSAAVEAVAQLADLGPRGSTTRRRRKTSQPRAGCAPRGNSPSTPYPPTGAAAGAVALSKLVGRVEWVAGNTAMIRDEDQSTEPMPARALTAGVAETLHETAELICDGAGHPVQDPARIEAVQAATRKVDQLMIAALEADVGSLTEVETAASAATAPCEVVDGDTIAGSLDPGFHARALGIATEMVADAALEAAGAEPVSDRTLAMADESAPQALARRLLSHLSFRSIWFRNALRGAVGLALAVAVVEVTNVQHGFWVVLGTLSVLRSNAVGTGATALRAVGGTALGFVVGSAHHDRHRRPLRALCGSSFRWRCWRRAWPRPWSPSLPDKPPSPWW